MHCVPIFSNSLLIFHESYSFHQRVEKHMAKIHPIITTQQMSEGGVTKVTSLIFWGVLIDLSPTGTKDVVRNEFASQCILFTAV